MNRLTLEQAIRMPVSDLAQCSAEQLYFLKLDAEASISMSEHHARHINRALDLRYAKHVRAMRHTDDLEDGVVHFDDGNVRVTAEPDVEVVWDQSVLADIAARLSRQGEDPFQYIDASYSIPAHRYRAWTPEQKATYALARIAVPKEPSYRLALMGEGGTA